MPKPKTGKGVIIGENVEFGEDVTIWNYVVIGDDTKIGDKTCIGSFCDVGKDVVIGKNCNIQAHVTISNRCKLGNNVFIGPNTSLLNDKYPLGQELSPPIIKDNVIVGGCVTILPGIIAHENSVIGAGSVVTKDVPAETVVAGAPAKPIMSKKDYESKREAFRNSLVET